MLDKILLAWSRLGTRLHLFSSLAVIAVATVLTLLTLYSLGSLFLLGGLLYFILVLTYDVPNKIPKILRVSKDIINEISHYWNTAFIFAVISAICIIVVVGLQLYIFLKDGDWIWYAASNFGVFNYEITTEWVGFNKIANWLVHECYIVIFLFLSFIVNLSLSEDVH